MTYAPPPEEVVLEYFTSLSNVGRWGPDDELGTMNFVTPAKVVEAARLVVSGRVVSVGQDLDTEPSAKNRNKPVELTMMAKGTGPGEPPACAERIAYLPHGPQVTHLDSVTHVFFEGKMWNGKDAVDHVHDDGMDFGSVYALRNGIVTRGVLLDVARARGVDYLPNLEYVTVDDFEAAEAMEGVRVGTGDALLVRTGLGAREAVEGPEDGSFAQGRTGLSPETVKWMYEREVCLFSADCTERMPSPYERVTLPLHQVASAAVGLNLVDHAAVEELARACVEERRWEFLYTVAPLRIPKSTGSAVNPLCIF
ncbi:MAG TPA: cyclase family protein [Acidimicrobiales bacterium]|nr:cyclase family protein [Acidimicrobiales bacterium]